MTVSATGVNFCQKAFHLNPGEKLAFNTKTNAFFSVQKGQALPKDCSSDLRKITERVDDLVQRVELSSSPKLGPTEALYLASNVRLLEGCRRKANAKIDKSSWLTFLDKFLTFVTFGVIHLKYTKPVEVGLADRFLQKQITRLINQDALPELLSLASFSKQFLSEKDYKSFFITMPLATFASAPFNQKNVICGFIANTVEDKSTIFEDGLLTQGLKVALLEHTIDSCGVGITHPLQDVVFSHCKEHYKDLDKNEKEILLKHTVNCCFKGVANPVADTVFSYCRENYKDLGQRDRVTLLRHSVNCSSSGVVNPLEDVVFSYCIENYKTLDRNELALIDTIITAKKLPKSREGLQLVMHHLTQKRLQTKYFTKIPEIIAQLFKLPDLKEADISSVLLLINSFSFAEVQNVFESLKKEHIDRITKFLVDIDDKKISNYNRLLLPLADFNISNDYDVFLNDEDLQDAVATLMQRCNVSALDKDSFKRLTQQHPLKVELEKSPDRYLATASEDQLEAYYRPIEKDIKINCQHLKTQVVTNASAPPLPPGVAIPKYQELEKMFEKINFKNKSKSDYVNPSKLTNAEGKPISVESLRRGMRDLVQDLIHRRAKTGMPNQIKNPEKYNEYYTNVQRYVQHIIVALNKRPEEDRSAYVIELALMGIYCGIRYATMSQDLYCQLTGAVVNIDNDSLEGGILKLLAPKRSLIAKKAITDIDANVHFIKAMTVKVGTELNLTEAATMQFEDVYESLALQAKVNLNAGTVRQKFYKEYDSTTIINEIMKHFEGVAGHPKTIKSEFRDTIIEYFKENVPPSLKEKQEADPENFSLLGEIYEMNTGRFKREWIIYLLKEIGVLDKPGSGVQGIIARLGLKDVVSSFYKFLGLSQ